MPLDAKQFAEFEKLIDPSGEKTERQCGAYLKHAAEHLCRRTPRKIVKVLQEDRMHYGNSDCIVIAEINDGRGSWLRGAFIWEVKAPQCLLFEKDENATRYRPTKDLVKAENQLIHYYHEIHSSDDFRRREGIADSAQIRLGGIIIGRSKCLCEGNEAENQVAENSLYIRNIHLYDRASFELWTWDEIANFLRPIQKIS